MRDTECVQVAYCHKCRMRTRYRKSYQSKAFEVRGVEYVYDEAQANCDKCGEEVYAMAVNDENCDARAAIVNFLLA